MFQPLKKRLSAVLPFLLVILSVVLILSGVIIYFEKCESNIQTNHLVINEIAVKNLLSLKDKAGNYSDWIELYNGTDEDICIGGYGISDDADKPFKYVIPSGTTIKSHDYFIVFSSYIPNDEEYNTGFAISEGECVLLTSADEATLDCVEIPETIDYGYSVGRCKNDSTKLAVLSTPTPGKFNNSAIISKIIVNSENVEAPEFSVDGGCYDEEFLLEITTDNPSAVIYYTLDGSEPDINSEVYTSPIKIKDRSDDENVYSKIVTSAYYYSFLIKPTDAKTYKGTVVRAKCYVNGSFSEECTTSTYFINPDYSLPIVSITTDPDNLFDDEKGIYVPGNDIKIWKKYNASEPTVNAPLVLNFGDTEVPGHVELFETDGTRVVDSDVGISINGKFSSTDRCKSLYIRASSRYGKSKIKYDIFQGEATDVYGESIDTYKGFVLRNSGTDWAYTLFRDAFFQTIAYDYLDSMQAYRPCILFIDGEYWGIHNIREKYCEEYFESHFGVDSDSVDLIKYSDVYPETVAGDENSADDFEELGQYAATHDLNVEEYYNYVDERLDIESYIKYMAYNIYIDNGDFLANNVRVWRSDDKDSEYGDYKWRFAVYDLDRALDSEKNMLERTLNEDKTLPQYAYIVLLRELVKRDDIKDEFIKQLEILKNDYFTDSRVDSLIDEMKANIQGEVNEHFDRWRFKRGIIGTILNGFDSSIEDTYYQNWIDSIENLRNVTKERSRNIDEQIEKYLS